MKAYFTLLLMGLGIVCLAQKSEPAKIVPAAPNAAAIARYGDVQANPNSGQISPSVPLYELKLNDFTLPISLNYANSGLKMSEVPGWVGLGWSIGAMGTISRQVRGIPDELNFGFQGQQSQATVLPSVLNDAYVPLPGPYNVPTRQEFLKKCLDNSFDTEPDLFMLSGPGVSTSFFFDTDQIASTTTKKATLIPRADMSLTATFNPDGVQNYNPTNKRGKITSFTLLDAQGNLYLYDLADGDFLTDLTLDDQIAWNESHYTTWYLTKITTVNGNVIDFEYDKRRISHPPTFRQSASIPVGLTSGMQPGTLIERPASFQTEVADFRLVKIRANGGADGTIIFTEQTAERADWTVRPTGQVTQKPHALDKVTIQNGLGEIIRQFDFTYEQNAARLLLRAVTERNGSVAQEPHVFSYHNEGSIPTYYDLNSGRFSEDYWGYYNGVGSDNLIPNFQYVFQPPYLPEVKIIGDNKTPRFSETISGQLSRITYPTKGYTQFEYEQNRYGDRPNPQNACPGPFDQVIGSAEITLDRNERFLEVPITLPVNSYAAQLCMQIDYKLVVGNEQSRDITYGEVMLKDESGFILFTTSLNAKVGEPTKIDVGTKVIKGNGSTNLKLSVFLSNEYYTSALQNNMARITIRQMTLTPNGLVETDGGGLRIKRQKSCPTADTEAGCLTKEYSYTDASGQSTGRLLMPLYFTSAVKKDVKTILSNYNDESVHVTLAHQQISSASQVPIVTSNGNSIYYEQVNVKEGGLTATGSTTYLGSTRYRYIPLSEAPDRVLRAGENYPLFSPVISGDWKRGKPISVSVLTASDVPLKESTSSYAVYDGYSTGTIALRCAAVYVNFKGDVKETETIGYGLSTGSHALFEETATDYSYDAAYSPASRTQLTQTTTTYYEGIPGHHLPTRSQTQNSKGEVVETRLAYPTDLTATTGDLLTSANALLGTGRRHTLIRQQNWVGGSLQKTDLNLYKPFSEVGLVLPWKSVQLLNASTDGPTTEFNTYTGKGNLVQSTTNGGYPITYLWSYNGSYPVAEIKNATTTQVQSALSAMGQSMASIASLTSSATLESHLTTLRTQLSSVSTDNTKVLMTGFTHQPGVGVRSIIAPNGVRTSYDYDPLGRLSTIYNGMNQKTKSYAYNYRSLGIATPLANQTVTAGQPADIALPANLFMVPGGISLNVSISGLPAGLTYQGNRITGTVSSTGDYTVIVKGQSGETVLTSSFQITVVAAEAFTILPPVVTCNPGSIVFSFQTKGGNGTPIRYVAAPFIYWTDSSGPHRFVPNSGLAATIPIMARQEGLSQIYSWNWQAACKSFNQAPIVGVIFTAPIQATVGYPLTLNLAPELFTDPEGGELLVEAVGLPAGLYMYGPNRITGVPTQAVSATVTLKATDPLGYMSSTTLVIQTVSSATAPAPLELLEPSYNCSTRLLSVRLKPNTGNGTPIEYMIVGATRWTTQQNDYLLDTLSRVSTLVARQVGTMVSYNFDWKGYCEGKNKAPYVTATKEVGPNMTVYPQTAVVGQPYALTLPARLFTDPDSDPLTLRVTNAPIGINLVNNSVLTGVASQTGSFRVNVEATDLYGAKTTTNFSLSATPATAFALLQPTYVCSTGSFTFNSAGGNGSAVQYMAVGITGWTTNRGPYTFQPAMDAAPFTLNAQQNGVTETYTWDWKAQCRSQNIPPLSNTATSLLSQTANTGVNYAYTLPANLFTDPDGQVLSYSVLGLPSGISYNGSNGLSGVPNQAGVYLVQVQARDPWGSLATRDFSLSILVPPILKLIPPTYLCSTGEFWYNSTGGNGTTVQYNAVGISGWTSSRGPYNVLPFADAGPFTLNAQQSGVTISYTWDWKAQCQQQNQPPRSNTAVSLPSLTVVSGSNVSYTIPSNAFIDPDSPSLTYSVTGLPSGLSLSGQTITGTTTALSTYTVTIKATDSYSATGTRTMLLTVGSTGPAFQLLAPSYNCTTKAFYFNSTGGDGTTIQYMAIGITGWTTASGPYTIDPASDAGPFTLNAQQTGVTYTYSWDWKANCP